MKRGKWKLSWNSMKNYFSFKKPVRGKQPTVKNRWRRRNSLRKKKEIHYKWLGFGKIIFTLLWEGNFEVFLGNFLLKKLNFFQASNKPFLVANNKLFITSLFLSFSFSLSLLYTLWGQFSKPKNLSNPWCSLTLSHNLWPPLNQFQSQIIINKLPPYFTLTITK